MFSAREHVFTALELVFTDAEHKFTPREHKNCNVAVISNSLVSYKKWTECLEHSAFLCTFVG